MPYISSDPSTNNRTPPIGRHVEVDFIRLWCPSNNGRDGPERLQLTLLEGLLQLMHCFLAGCKCSRKACNNTGCLCCPISNGRDGHDGGDGGDGVDGGDDGDEVVTMRLVCRPPLNT